MEHAFGRRTPFELGMEEELLLVDERTHALAHASSDLLPRVQGAPGRVMHDTYEALVESASPVARNALEGGRHLGRLRGAIRAAGGTFIGAGVHPDAAFGDVVHVPQPRYAVIAEAMRGLTARTPTCATHLHVGMPDPETAVVACNRMRLFLPLLQALAANSPFWHGRDSGFQTARAQLFRGYPTAGIPRTFAGWEDYAETVEAVVRAGELPDYTFLWWDIRPHPNLGTLEVRAMDAQSRLATVVGLAALAHALMVLCAHEEPPEPAPPVEAIAESSFRAGRDGLAATIWWDGGLRPLPEVAAAVLEVAEPWAGETGGREGLEEVRRVLAEGNGADRQRAANARGGMPELLRALVAETLAAAQPA